MNRFIRGVVPFLSVIAASLMVLSALTTGILEGNLALPPSATPRPTLPPPNLTPIGALPQTPTQPVVSETALPPTQTACPMPSGWEIITVQAGDTLSDLAAQRSVPLNAVLSANCLASEMIVAGAQIYLPALPTPSTSATRSRASTSAAPACAAPRGWVRYRVQSGDTLTRLSGLYRVSVWQLRQANCLYGDLIVAGSRIWVPNVATSTFTALPDKPEPPPATPTVPPTLSPTPIPSGTITITPTSTPMETLTPSPEPTRTETTVTPASTNTTQPPPATTATP